MRYQASNIESTRAIPDMAPFVFSGVPLHVRFEHVCCKIMGCVVFLASVHHVFCDAFPVFCSSAW